MSWSATKPCKAYRLFAQWHHVCGMSEHPSRPVLDQTLYNNCTITSCSIWEHPSRPFLDQTLYNHCAITSCSIWEHPSRPFLDQTLCKHSGVLVQSCTEQALSCNTQQVHSGLTHTPPPPRAKKKLEHIYVRHSSKKYHSVKSSARQQTDIEGRASSSCFQRLLTASTVLARSSTSDVARDMFELRKVNCRKSRRKIRLTQNLDTAPKCSTTVEKNVTDRAGHRSTLVFTLTVAYGHQTKLSRLFHDFLQRTLIVITMI